MLKVPLPRKKTRSRRRRRKLNPEVFSPRGRNHQTTLEIKPDRSAPRNPIRMFLFMQLWKMERRKIPRNSVPAVRYVRLFCQPVRSKESRRGSVLRTRRIRRLHLRLRPRCRWTTTPRAPTACPPTTWSPTRTISGVMGQPGRGGGQRGRWQGCRAGARYI